MNRNEMRQKVMDLVVELEDIMDRIDNGDELDAVVDELECQSGTIQGIIDEYGGTLSQSSVNQLNRIRKLVLSLKDSPMSLHEHLISWAEQERDGAY